MRILTGIRNITIGGLIRQVLFFCLPKTVYVKICYRYFSKRKIDLKNPKRLSEKWWCVYYNKKYCSDIIKKVADKYTVHEYMEEKGKETFLKKLYGVYDSLEEIDFNDLPDKFALKITQESGLNIICVDKAQYGCMYISGFGLR